MFFISMFFVFWIDMFLILSSVNLIDIVNISVA